MDHQRHGDICTTVLYPEAIIPHQPARRTRWGPWLVALLMAVTAGIALAWSLGLAGLRYEDETAAVGGVAAAAATPTPRSPYPAELPNLSRHPALPAGPSPPQSTEPVPIAEPLPVAVEMPPPLPAPLPASHVKRVRAPPSPLPPVVTAPRITSVPKPAARIAAPQARSPVGTAVQPRAARPLGGLLSGLFVPSDYPIAARRNGEHGDVTVRLAIGTDGRIAGCHVLAADASPTLKAATCSILARRARFAAATDQHGAATPDAVVQHVAWRLP